MIPRFQISDSTFYSLPPINVMFSKFQAMLIGIIESKMRGHIALVLLLAALSRYVNMFSCSQILV